MAMRSDGLDIALASPPALLQATVAECQSVDAVAKTLPPSRAPAAGIHFAAYLRTLEEERAPRHCDEPEKRPHLMQERILREFAPRASPRQQNGLLIKMLFGHTFRHSVISHCTVSSLLEGAQRPFIHIIA